MPIGQSVLPEFLSPFFWDTDFAGLSRAKHWDFIVRRILRSGSWQAVSWLWAELGDAGLRQWLVDQRGAGLSPRQLRFWEAMLDLPHERVTGWIAKNATLPWENRIAR